MAFRPIAFRRGAASGIALGASLAIAAVIGMSGSTNLVQSSFDRALTTRDAPATSAALGRSVDSVPLAQSEEFWLRGHHGSARVADVKPVAWSGQLSRGDRITIAQAGSQRVLEVVETTPVAIDTTRLDDSSAGSQLIAVTCRDTAQPDAPVLRFIVSEGALPFAVTRGAVKAL